MKTFKHIILVAAAALTVNIVPATQAGEPSALAESSKNTALLHSPRYREEHPEVLRTGSAFVESTEHKTKRLAELTENSALANSPRFREEHPELRWVASPAEPRQAINEVERLRKLTENTALANSPRFREEHPELLRGEPEFEIAPLK
jgi:hypothetical protein